MSRSLNPYEVVEERPLVLKKLFKPTFQISESKNIRIGTSYKYENDERSGFYDWNEQ